MYVASVWEKGDGNRERGGAGEVEGFTAGGQDVVWRQIIDGPLGKQ